MAAVIRAEGLVKTFGRTRALDGLDLEVDAGEVRGFLGPNGAGKSTTIRVLLGMLRARGTAVVLGRDAWRDAVAIHRDVASVPGDVTLWPNLSGGETIDLLTGLRGGADPQLRRRLLDDFALDPRVPARAALRASASRRWRSSSASCRPRCRGCTTGGAPSGPTRPDPEVAVGGACDDRSGGPRPVAPGEPVRHGRIAPEEVTVRERSRGLDEAPTGR